MPPEVSDHFLQLMKLQGKVNSPHKPFRLFNYWVQHDGYLDVVKELWSLYAYGSPM